MASTNMRRVIATPYFIPCVAGDEHLKFSGERIGFTQRFIDPRITEDTTTVNHSGFNGVHNFLGEK
jgi:hypothetical protein